jgi:hypothetical protein
VIREPSPKKRKVDRVDVREEATVVQASPRRARTRSQRTKTDAPNSEPVEQETIEVIEDSQDEGEEEYVPGLFLSLSSGFLIMLTLPQMTVWSRVRSASAG